MNASVLSPRGLAARQVAVFVAILMVALLTYVPAGVADAQESVPGGPVILDGNDPGDHPSEITSYIQDVYTSLDTNVAAGYVHNGEVAVIGTCKTYLDTMGTGQTFVGYTTAASVESLFDEIGTNNYKHIHICSDNDQPSTLTTEVQAELDKWGSAIARHVNRGGGLFATGHQFNWLNDLFPSIAVTFGGTSASYVTAAGADFFPSLSLNDQVSAINHYTFTDSGSTPLLPLLTETVDGGGLLVAIGGTTVRFPQISISGPSVGQVGDEATYTLTAADADGNPLSSNAFNWEITGATDDTGSGSATTDANGEYVFAFSGNAAGDTRLAVQMTLGTGESAGSSITTNWATVPEAPAITSAVDVTGEDGSVLVSWNAPDDGGRSILDYLIEYSTDGIAWATFSDPVSTTTSATVTGLDDGTEYLFRVAAVNELGPGAFSPPVAATPVGSPSAPAIQSVAPLDGAVDVDWDAPVSDNGGAVTHYVVEWRILGAATWTTLDPDPTATSATVSGLTNGELYEFRVAAVNENGTGSFSDVLDGGPATVPGSIDEVTVTEADGELVFAWPEPSSDGGAPITGYEIAADFAADCEPDHWHPDADGDHRHWWRCTIDDLDNGHEYTFDVAAVNSQGAGDATEATGIPYGAPLAPAVSIAEEGDQAITVTWTEANGNGRDVTGYEIHIDGELMVSTPPSDPTTLDIGDLANGHTYTVGVRGVNAAGVGTLGEAQGTPYTVPDAPEVSTDGEDGVATVTWTEPFDGGRSITTYLIAVAGDGVEETVEVDGTNRSHEFSDLDAGTYTVQVSARNLAGEGPYRLASLTLVVAEDDNEDTGDTTQPGDGFIDTGGTTFEDDIAWMKVEGLTKGCNPPDNTRYCPHDVITRAEVAAFLDRYFRPDATDVDAFSDDDGHTFESELNRTNAAQIFRGCNPPANDRVCPNRTISRGQLAAVIFRSFGLEDATDNPFVDSVGHHFEREIAGLAAHGITRGCNPPDRDNFCPDRLVTRGEIAALLRRAANVSGQ